MALAVATLTACEKEIITEEDASSPSPSKAISQTNGSLSLADTSKRMGAT